MGKKSRRNRGGPARTDKSPSLLEQIYSGEVRYPATQPPSSARRAQPSSFTAMNMNSVAGGGGGADGGGPTTCRPNAWANGLTQQDQYEWFSNCYQMRCDDDYVWGGCNLHGPYDPNATPHSITEDLLVYCLLAHRVQAVPVDWNWHSFLKEACRYVPFVFEKSDAQERWGSENVFQAQMGGRSLRFTGTHIYKSDVDKPGNSREYLQAEQEMRSDTGMIQEQVGGRQAWTSFLEDIRHCNRFT